MAGSRSLALAVITAGSVGFAVVAWAELTPEHRKSISEVAKEVGKVSAIVRKKEFDEADKALKDAEDKLKAIATEAGVKEDDRAFTSVNTAITKARKTLDLARDKASGKKPEQKKAVSFAKDVAPI